jgi:hypothetical protein
MRLGRGRSRRLIAKNPLGNEVAHESDDAGDNDLSHQVVPVKLIHQQIKHSAICDCITDRHERESDRLQMHACHVLVLDAQSFCRTKPTTLLMIEAITDDARYQTPKNCVRM